MKMANIETTVDEVLEFDVNWDEMMFFYFF